MCVCVCVYIYIYRQPIQQQLVVTSSDVYIVEGILVLYFPRVRALLDMKVSDVIVAGVVT